MNRRFESKKTHSHTGSSIIICSRMHVLLGCTSVLRIPERIGWILPHEELHVEVMAQIHTQVHGEEDPEPLRIAQGILRRLHARVEHGSLAYHCRSAWWWVGYGERSPIPTQLVHHNSTADKCSHGGPNHGCRHGKSL